MGGLGLGLVPDKQLAGNGNIKNNSGHGGNSGNSVNAVMPLVRTPLDVSSSTAFAALVEAQVGEVLAGKWSVERQAQVRAQAQAQAQAQVQVQARVQTQDQQHDDDQYHSTLTSCMQVIDSLLPAVTPSGNSDSGFNCSGSGSGSSSTSSTATSTSTSSTTFSTSSGDSDSSATDLHTPAMMQQSKRVVCAPALCSQDDSSGQQQQQQQERQCPHCQKYYAVGYIWEHLNVCPQNANRDCGIGWL
jgi:hypothetical protein